MKQNLIRFYTLPNVYNIGLVHGINVLHHFPRHIHTSFTCGIIEKGARKIVIDGHTYAVVEGECFFINPGEPHSTQKLSSKENHDYWIVSIPSEIIRQIFSDISETQGIFPRFAPSVVQDITLFTLIKEFSEEVQTAGECFMQESRVLEIITHCLLTYARIQEQYDDPSCGVIARVRTYIEERFEKNLRLADLAQIAHASPYYLNRLFQREVGIPPYEYLIKIRLQKAQKLLREGESIASTAYRTGFSDQSHLTRFFKRHIGMTPGEYVQTLKKKEGLE